MAQRPPFELRKWYLDCAAASGELVIAYQAELRWRRLSLTWASVLVHRAGRLRTRSTLRAGAAPEEGPDGIAWRCAPLRLRGRWSALCPPVREVLLAQGEERVEWDVRAPRARVELSLAGERLAGLGYAERLTLTLPPWRLPLDELRWGRFCAEEGGLVWLEWRGEAPRRRVLLDGAALEEASVGEEGVSARGAALRFGAREVLREGRIGDTVLRAIPALERAPARLLGLTETKWRLPARLSRPGRPDVEGEAIHEVVRWP